MGRGSATRSRATSPTDSAPLVTAAPFRVASVMTQFRAESRGMYQHLMGTNVEIVVAAEAASDDEAYAQASACEDVAVAELERLQRVFSVFDPASELVRWRTGELDAVSPDLAAVLSAAAHWWRVSGGAFHPCTGLVRARWLRAAAEGVEPAAAELHALAGRLATLPFEVVAGTVVRTGDCAGVDLNAIAKGYLVDRAVAAAIAAGAVEVLVNAGGDLRHHGARVLRVGIEDPAAVGGPPGAVVELREGAIATSGPVHRGFQVGATWFGHVLDPRTATPVIGRPSTTVRAPDAMTADAFATVAGVVDWEEATALVGSCPGVGVLAITADGDQLTCGEW